MEKHTDWKRILIFCAIAFGISWAAALVLYLNGGLLNSPELVPDTGITLAIIILPTAYMGAPALAHILTRLLTKEGWKDMMLRFKLRRELGFWALAWIGPAVLTIIGMVLYFLVLPEYYDPDMAAISNLMAQYEQLAGINPWMYALQQTISAILISPLVNGLFTFGEEFGWRGYLQPKLKTLGAVRAMILTGLIWGLWHAPAILMGHNYGLDYPGAPWLGVLAMIWFTLVTGVFIGWVTLKAGSVWPAVIAHAALNGIANLASMFTQGTPNPLLGPLPVGIVASIPFTLFAVWILVSMNPKEGVA